MKFALWAFALVAANAIAAPFAYLTNNQRQLDVVDLATNAVTAQIPVGPATIGVAVSSAGDRVYVVDNTEGVVRVVNTATNTVTATITVCTGAYVPGLNPQGTRLVVPCTDINTSQVAIIDTATNTVVAHATTGAGPATVAWNPSGTRFYVSNLSAATVTVFDGSSYALLQTITGMLGTFAMVFDPAGTRLYAANLLGVLAVVDTSSGAILSGVAFNATPYWVAINPAGTRLYVPQAETSSVLVLDAATLATVATIQTGSGAVGLNLSADGTRLYVQLSGGDLATYDATTYARLATAHLPSATLGLYGQFVRPAAAVPAANTPGALSGQWWNHNESGWGIHFTQRGSNIFAAWYTYDAAGNPKWYVSTCAMSSATACAGTVYQVSGPRFFGVAFDPTAVNATAAGTLSVTFSGNDAGSMSYSVGGVSRTVAIERQVLAASGTAPTINYTDIWWGGASESGWGLALTQQFSTMFLAWYVYSDSGQPVWYVATLAVANGNSASGTLYRTTGPAFGATFDPSAVQASPVGTASVTFSDGNNGTLAYTVNGVTGTKAITRQLF
jgi:YVTN family beta-propeller protein